MNFVNNDQKIDRNHDNENDSDEKTIGMSKQCDVPKSQEKEQEQDELE